MLLLDPKVLEAESKIQLSNITWLQYETFLEMLRDRPLLRLTYLESNLEIMTISPEHEMLKKMIARLLEIYALEKDIDLFSCGSATFRNQATARGLEPDESYCVGNRKQIPDVAIEVIITSGNIDKLEVYRGLQVPEVWFWDKTQQKFSLYQLQSPELKYQSVTRSQFFPNLELELLSKYIKPETEPQNIKNFRQEILKS